jgi:hypothetical protein
LIAAISIALMTGFNLDDLERKIPNEMKP